MWFYAGIQGLNSAHKQWIIGWFKMNIIYLCILSENRYVLFGRVSYLETNEIYLNYLLKNLNFFEGSKQHLYVRTINKIFTSAVLNSTEFCHYIPS